MGTLGKVLAALNVLAALAFLAMTGMNWGMRQAWTYQVFRHQLALEGLPIDAADSHWQGPDRPISDNLGEETLADLFQRSRGGDQLGGGPVPSQQAEVERVRDVLVGLIASAANEADQRKLLGQFLLNQQRTPIDREKLRQQIFGPNSAPVSDLVGELQRTFDAVLTPKLYEPGDPPKAARDRDEKRLAIAYLLYNLSLEVDWHQRVQTVVGLTAYERAVDRSAGNLANISSHVRQTLITDQTVFESQYRSLTYQLPGLAREVEELEVKLKDAEQLVQKHEVLVNSRKMDVAEFEAKYAEAKATVAKETAALAEAQQKLFNVIALLGQTDAKNRVLEREIRQLELGY